MIDSPDRASMSATDPCAVHDLDSEGAAGTLAAAAWRWSHRHALAAAAEPQSLAWSQIVALALALALNLTVLLRLTLPPGAEPPTRWQDDSRLSPPMATSTHELRVVWVEPTATADVGDVASAEMARPASPAARPDPLPPASASPATPPTSAATAPAGSHPAIVSSSDAPALPAVAEASAPAARLFLADGSVSLPASVIEEIRGVEGAERAFDFVSPGRTKAATAFSRQPALPYAPTRFDGDWKPVRTLGQDIIVPIAELLTFENKRKTFRCSLLPPVCSWGRTDPGLELNDPATLNPAEQAQCRLLWDAIVAASDQGEWLRLRRQFDSECRKPVERDGTPPAPQAPEAGRN